MRNKVINYDIDSNFCLDGTPTMERLRHKSKLIKDTNEIFSDLSKLQLIYPKGYYKKVMKEIKKDVYKGFKVINEKNPVFIEMPKLNSVGNGMISKTVSDNISEDENIEVNLPITENLKLIK